MNYIFYFCLGGLIGIIIFNLAYILIVKIKNRE